MSSPAIRSTGAVVAGFVGAVILAVICDLVLRAGAPHAFGSDGFVANPGFQVVVLVYSAVAATFGGWLAGRLAPSRPMRHALILGWISVVLTLLGTAAAWSHAPIWYHAIAILIVLPAAWCGGSIARNQRTAGAANA